MHCTNHLIRLQFCNLILPVDEKAAERALKHQKSIQKENVECKPEKLLLMRTWIFIHFDLLILGCQWNRLSIMQLASGGVTPVTITSNSEQPIQSIMCE